MDNNKTLAVVADREITELDLQLLLRSLDPQRAMQFQNQEGKMKLIEELINQELFYLDAIKTGVDKEEVYQRELQKVQENFLKHYTIQRFLSTVQISEAELEDYYNANKDEFKNPVSAKASHILVSTEEKANEVLKEIEEGLSFEEAAQKYSSCPSSSRGGDLGNFAKGQMVPEFDEAVFNMEVDEISEPVKTQFGYHIIKLFEIKPEETRTFAQVVDILSQQMLMEKQQEIYFDKINKLKEEYEIKIIEE